MRKYLFSYFLLFHLSLGFLQANDRYLFTEISLGQGLSQSTVWAVAQDSVGYMWFATQDGLNRYNGYEIEVFRANLEDSLSIASRGIRSLCVDHDNYIWIGGDNGISSYSYTTDCFKNYKLFDPEERNSVISIVTDAQNEVWLSTQKGEIYLYNRDNDCFKQVNTKPAADELLSVGKIKDYGHSLLICAEQGLYRLDKSSYQLSPVAFNDHALQIHDIDFDAKGNLWVATGDKGVLVLNKQFQLIKHYQSIVGDEHSLVNNKVRALNIDKEGTVWIGTFKGLSVLNPETDLIMNYQHVRDQRFSLSHNSIRSIYVDSDEGVWIGTYFGGVSYYHKNNIQFQTIGMYSSSPARLNDNLINCMVNGTNGQVWFGTNDNGLNCWDTKSNEMKYYTTPSIKSLFTMEDGSLLIGTHWGGLLHFFPDTPGKNRTFRKSNTPASIQDDRVEIILQDSRKQIWVGTYNGLLKFDVHTGKFTPFTKDKYGKELSSKSIVSLFADSQNRLWIGTFNGLNIYHMDQDTLEIFKYSVGDSTSLSANEITCFFEDSKNRIWIGTCDGINCFDEASHSFRRYTVKDGLCNGFICAMLEDRKGNLWISTHGGLMSFNPNKDEWRYFVKAGGLQSSQFNQASACALPDGRIMFGGLNGVTIFYPEEIRSFINNDRVLFTDLWVNSKRIHSNDDTGILKEHLSQVEEIKLKHDQNVLTIKFSSINFNIDNKLVYQYCLKGLYDKWQEVNGNLLTLTDLPVGDYTLYVKVDPMYASNGKETISQLHIVVLSPWWKSPIMIIIYTILCLVALVLVLYIAKERIRMHNELNVEKLKKQKMEELQTQQMQFFVNVSHEFKTPLTLIISPIEMLMDMVKGDEWQSRQLNLVYKNAKLLLSLIEQLIHFRRVENGQVKCQASKHNIISSLSSIYTSFHSYAKRKNINYVFDVELKEFNMLYDSSILERICFNFLSNAFKFTPTGGSITLSTAKKDGYFAISVKDTGKGIPKELHQKIFERFYTASEGESVGGTGIGLTYARLLAERHHGFIELESELGVGSTFVINLPLSEEAFEASEIVTDMEKGKLSASLPNMEEDMEESLTTQEGASDEKSATILVVDDNPSITNFLSESLSNEYNVDIAHDGQEALNRIEERMYDLVICDVMMPKINGIVLCRKIKQNIRTSHIPVIMLSAKSEVEHQIEGLEMGADEYMPKPFSMKLLESKIQNIISLRKQLKELYKNSIDVNPDKIAYFSIDQEFLAKAAKFVEEHISDPEFSVETFAEMMCMSRSNLHLKFKAITGDSISEFIKKIRFKKSMELLESGRYNVSEISMMTGFSTPSYFSKTFKKYFGYLPTEYKKQKGD